ncbi:hypothetical protein [Acinetobacter radioresistens]|uniref:hypothetical protein n=1 Tax=Acinetobacter radioresistens TaxID=40216 RepID=UPI003B28B506
MQQSFFGELFGVKIHLPVSRNEVKQLIYAKSDFAGYLVQEKSIPLHRAQTELDQDIHKFVRNMEKSQANRFYEYLIEESAVSAEEFRNQIHNPMTLNYPKLRISGDNTVRRKHSVWSYMSWFLLIGCVFLGIYWFDL